MVRQSAEPFLAKANESLAGADRELAARAYNNAANRAYYACFQAAVALLIELQQYGSPGERHNHAEVWAKLNTKAIRQRKLLQSDFASRIQELVGSRQDADYGETHVTERKARRAATLAAEFVGAVKACLARQS